MNVQKTIAKPGSLSGTGIHTGKSSTVTFRPAATGSGVQFFKDGKKLELCFGTSLRQTSIGHKELAIHTVEHLLSALYGLGISNLEVEVEGPEIPGLDGSAAGFVTRLKELGIVDQSAPREVFKISEPIFCFESDKAIAVYPADQFSVAYTLDYDHPFLRAQTVDFALSPEVFETQIAPARTFCTEAEAATLREKGFGLGANFENTLVVSKTGVVNNRFRLDHEPARHKVLDIIGDLSLLGYPILGRVIGIRSGHSLNRKLVEKIAAQKTGPTKQKGSVMKASVMEIEEIKKILPHRYPFLLVDRILELKENSAVGLKNVSASEPYFQGHFPGKPVMPGVMIVESLAQVGGILMLSKSDNKGKLAFLVAINSARFRKMVVPGDQLRLEIEIVKMKAKVGVMKGRALVNGEEVCDTEIMFTLS